MPSARLNRLRRLLYWRVRTRQLAIQDGRFQPTLRVDPEAPALLLSPHWDDSVLDCWGLLASERALTVVNVFAGSPPARPLTLWDSITGAADSTKRTHERRAEDAAALARAKRTPVNLSFLDNQYRTEPGPPLQALDAGLAVKVAAASHVYVPAGLGSHPDHLLVRRYGRMLMRVGMPVSLYADVPYCVAHGWPDWVDGSEPEPNRNVDAFWMSFLGGVPELPPLRSAHVERLDDHAAAAKLDALRCYRTQFPALDAGSKRMLSDPEIHRFEVRWELKSSAQPSLS